MSKKRSTMSDRERKAERTYRECGIALNEQNETQKEEFMRTRAYTIWQRYAEEILLFFHKEINKMKKIILCI